MGVQRLSKLADLERGGDLESKRAINKRLKRGKGGASHEDSKWEWRSDVRMSSSAYLGSPSRATEPWARPPRYAASERKASAYVISVSSSCGPLLFPWTRGLLACFAAFPLFQHGPGGCLGSTTPLSLGSPRFHRPWRPLLAEETPWEGEIDHGPKLIDHADYSLAFWDVACLVGICAAHRRKKKSYAAVDGPLRRFL